MTYIRQKTWTFYLTNKTKIRIVKTGEQNHLSLLSAYHRRSLFTEKLSHSPLTGLIEKIKSDIETERLKITEKKILPHQMRKCFKIGSEGCPLNPDYQNNKIFIAMPFSDEYKDSYNYGIVPVLDGLGYQYYKADNEITNKDIMCKICQQIQSCQMAIINISGLNPNVMLEQGLAYGLGKPVIILKDKATKAISDLGSIEYIEYSHAGDLQQKLYKALDTK